MSRQAELAERLAAVEEQIAAACARAGRDRSEVTLVVVTKFFPASDVALLAELGCREFGESRDQEASAKIEALGALEARWHMIGRMQRNKARSVASWAQVVQSVDDSRLVAALAKAAPQTGLDVLLQVSLDGGGETSSTSRGGALPEDIPTLAALVAEAPSLRLRGVMAIPPLEADPAQAYAKLAQIHADLLVRHPQASTLSAGMSGDLETAIAFGSSCVRVGTAILGGRPIPSP